MILDDDVCLVDSAPTQEEAKHLCATLRVRLWNSTHGGKSIYGLAQLIGKLEQVDDSSKVLGYGFISPTLAGNIYVLDESQLVLGAAIVDRNRSPQDIPDILGVGGRQE